MLSRILYTRRTFALWLDTRELAPSLQFYKDPSTQPIERPDTAQDTDDSKQTGSGTIITDKSLVQIGELGVEIGLQGHPTGFIIYSDKSGGMNSGYHNKKI